MGFQAHQFNSGEGSIGIGLAAGQYAALGSINNIAIGTLAGQLSQQGGSVAIGYLTGNINQQAGAIALGYQAGQNTQGLFSIAVGYQAHQFGNQQGRASAHAVPAHCQGLFSNWPENRCRPQQEGA